MTAAERASRTEEDEVEGIDFVEHGESGYDLTNRGGSLVTKSGVVAAATAPVSAPSDAPEAESTTSTKEGTMA